MRISTMTKTWIAALALAAGSSAWAGVQVTFEKPDDYSDVPFSSRDREQVLAGLADHFSWLGKSLPPGQDLRIEITDVDLAGREDPARRGAFDVRVMTGRADWPRLRLRYTLEQHGKVIASGNAYLSDMSYLQHINRYSSNDALRYEKRMIDECSRIPSASSPRAAAVPS
ncbi:DUF3016 domain-containing protein [Janthinobacterium agaricidamnosum]|uniref:DUF3016 domain-containing protein n=1 Tax=Janthinobacterium agaricidamnosum TaxID=55508 RepID=A0A3G2E3H5_9BURK|nr:MULTISPECIES: DUF3016 domain-containing protein [Janthinobacterium]AYM74547.1 DUF3016 domain-containing protein [Janthinobacterium agaricidamnosum]OEZ95240.1 hypothetical protein JAB9_35020 [Janthinobacterium sp. HH107]